MALIWTTTDRFSAEHGVKIGVYSDSGFGKTYMCSTAPRPIICSVESGLLSLKKMIIPTAIVHSLQELMEFYRWVTQSNEARNFDTICLDSASEIAEVILKEAKDAPVGGNKDPRAAYGLMQERVTEELKKFRDLAGKHVYLSFKQEPVKDDFAGITRYGPMFPGKNLGPATPYMLDEFFVLRKHQNIDPTTGKHYRYLQTDGDLQYIAKDRSGSLAVVEPPDLTHVISKIMAGVRTNGQG